ncbi:MAG: response regulator [Candidatus Sericytochromatia bacterium]
MEPLNILIVDDEPVNLEVAGLILRAVGHTVRTAANGREAVEVCLTGPERFDLVIMDLIMPVMSGEEAIRRLRDEPATRDMPILALSAKETRQSGPDVGWNRFLAKPYQAPDLIRAVLATATGAVS